MRKYRRLGHGGSDALFGRRVGYLSTRVAEDC